LEFAIEEGQPYIEPGFAAFTYLNREITAQVQVSGHVVTYVPGRYELTYTVTDAGFTTTALRGITITPLPPPPEPEPDLVPPVLTPTGSPVIILHQGSTYTEQGAQAWDEIDGNVTHLVQIGGDYVDTNRPGSYHVSYTATDYSGNSSYASREVRVLAPEKRYDRTNQTFSGSFQNKNAAAVSRRLRVTGEANMEISIAVSSKKMDSTVAATLKDSSGRALSSGQSRDNINLVLTGLPAGEYNLELSIRDGNGADFTASLTIEEVTTGFAQAEVPLGSYIRCQNSSDDASATPCNEFIMKPLRKDITPQEWEQGFWMAVCPKCGHEFLVPLSEVLAPPPVISMIGAPLLLHQRGHTYRDQGVTAKTLGDQELSAEDILTWGYVDIANPGWYTITYWATDEENNTARAQRLVCVFDPLEEKDFVESVFYDSLGSTYPTKKTQTIIADAPGEIFISLFPTSGGAQEGVVQATLRDTQGSILAQGEDFSNFLLLADLPASGVYFLDLELTDGTFANVTTYAMADTAAVIMEETLLSFPEDTTDFPPTLRSEEGAVPLSSFDVALAANRGIIANCYLLNVRLSYGATQPIIGALGVGTELSILEEKYGWCRIQTANLEGWVDGDYVQR